MRTLFYEDPPLRARERAIFLAGPTVSAKAAQRTAWRTEALSLLAYWDGLVIVPEFREGGFRREPFDDGKPVTVPGMTRASERILEWETLCIDHASVLLAWMPFAVAEETSPASLPGFSTRAEVMRAIALGRFGLSMGMPHGAVSGGQIRYHAHRGGYAVFETLADTIGWARALAAAQGPGCEGAGVPSERAKVLR